MNDLWGAIAANASTQECDRIFEQLEIYTVAHFGAEETMMQALAYPNLAEHRLAHREFVQRIKRERAGLQAGRRLGLDITHFLRDWLVKHILVNDRAYADFYEQRSKPSGFLGRFFSRFRSHDLTHG
jgi:hemerythrin